MKNERELKFEKFTAKMKEIGIPIAYHHFIEPVEAPFLVYYSPETVNFLADNTIYYQLDAIDVELYTEKKDIKLENMIHEALTDLNIIYKQYEVFIQEENLFMNTFELQL